MTKENILFVIIGLLGGFMGGFFFANSVNQSAMQTIPITQSAAQQGAAGLPSGHPAVPGADGGSAPEIQAAIEKAKRDPTNFDAQIKAAELYYQIQRFDSAAEFPKKANELQPDNYDVMVNLGNAYFDAGRYVDAEKTYAKALAKKPDDMDLRTDMGLTFIFRDDPNYERAIQEFKRVLASNANHVQALQNLTVAYTKRYDKTNASATLARLEQTDANNNAIPKLREEIEKIGSK